MSITKEQAATWFETMYPPGPAVREMYRMAAKALRPVSREQVEKVWRGYWIHEEIQSNQSTTGYFKISSCKCSKCGCYVQQEVNFCPYCMAAMTDEAVDMVMERLEALNEN